MHNSTSGHAQRLHNRLLTIIAKDPEITFSKMAHNTDFRQLWPKIKDYILIPPTPPVVL
jgi:hypothetical protein